MKLENLPVKLKTTLCNYEVNVNQIRTFGKECAYITEVFFRRKLAETVSIGQTRAVLSVFRWNSFIAVYEKHSNSVGH